MSTIPYPSPAAFGSYSDYAGFGGYSQNAAQYGAAASDGIERQVVPEMVQVPVTQTVMVPKTTYQQRYVQIPVQQTIQVPRVVSPDFCIDIFLFARN
jgi:hypothetical protein